MGQDRIARFGQFQFGQTDGCGLNHGHIGIRQCLNQRGRRFGTVKIGQGLCRLFAHACVGVRNRAGQIGDRGGIGAICQINHRHDAGTGRGIIQPLGQIRDVVEFFEKRTHAGLTSTDRAD